MAPWEQQTKSTAPWEKKEEDLPVLVQQIKDAVDLTRMANPLEGIYTATKGALALPIEGLTGLAGIATGQGLDKSIEMGQKASEATVGRLPKTKNEEALKQAMGAGFSLPGEALAKGGSLVGQEVANTFGLSEAERLKMDAIMASIGQGYGDVATPVPGAKGLTRIVEKPIHSHIGKKLEKEIQTQEYTNPDKIDPLTQGAQSTVAPWEKTTGQLELPLGGDPVGLSPLKQEPHYESGLPPDAYLKGNMEPTGQGDLFAGTRPYAEGEPLPRGADAVARAAALERALTYSEPTLERGAGPEGAGPFQGDRTLTRTEIPAVEYDTAQLQDPRIIERQIEDLQRQREILRNAVQYEQPWVESKYQAKQRIKEQGLPPGYEQIPVADRLRWIELEDKRVQERLLELENLQRQLKSEAIPFDRGMRTEPNSAAPMKETPKFKYEGALDWEHPDGLNNQLGLKETQQRNIRPEEISTKLENEPTQGRLDFPTADGSGIVKMGNGGYIDWKATAEALRAVVKVGEQAIKIIGRHLDLNDGPHGVMRLNLVDDRSGKRLGEIDLSPKQRFDPVDGKNNPLVANVHLVPEARGKGIASEMYKWIANNIGDLVQNKGSTRDGGQRLWSSLERNGIAQEGRISKEQFPTADGSGIVNLGNGGFIPQEHLQKAGEFIKNTLMGRAGNTPAALKQAAMWNALDKRPAKEVVASLDPKLFEDVSSLDSKIANITDQSGIVEITKNLHGAGPLIKWTHDAFKLQDRMNNMIKENLLNGKEFLERWRGFETREAADKSPLKLTQTAIKSDLKGFGDFIQTWFEASKNGVEPTFKDAKYKEIYDSWQGVFSYLHGRMNGLRMEAGLPAIGKQTAYFPLMREGDWRVVAQDGNGNLVGAWHFETRKQANKFQTLLSKNKELSVSDTQHLEPGKYDQASRDFTALEAANKALADQPDILAKVQQAYADAIGRRGFGGKHSVESQHLLGAMGLVDPATGKFTHKEAVRALKAMEMYTEKSMDYISNLEKRNKMSEMVKAIAANPELRGKADSTIRLMTDMYDSQRGALKDQAAAVTWAFNEIARMSGLGETGARNMMRQVSSMATMWFLSTTSFLASQLAQPLTGFAGLTMSEGGGLRGAGYAAKDVFKGFKEALMPSPESIEAVNWATKNGYIDSQFAEMYGARHLTNSPLSMINKYFSRYGSKVEREFVRIPYYLMQIEALKGQIKDKKQLFEAAGERTDHYMVNYDHNNMAMIWNRLGTVGETARPLKQFSNNFLGQFYEYAREAKHGDLTPLMLMLGTSYVLAGLTGNMISQTTDDLIKGMNAIAGLIGVNLNLPTLHEMVMKSNMSDFSKFGAGSVILGHDVSSSVAQNSVKSMLSLPSIGFTGQVTLDPAKWLIKKWQGKDTVADRMNAYLAVTPPAFKKMVEEQFVKNGIVPDPRHNMEAVYKRTPEEQSNALKDAFLYGRPSLNEAKAKALIRAAREDLMEQSMDRKSSAAKLADVIIEGGQVTPELLQQYISEGGDPKNLTNLVKNRLIDRSYNLIDQQQMKKGISGQAAREVTKDEKQSQDGFKKMDYSDNADRHFEQFKKLQPKPKHAPWRDEKGNMIRELTPAERKEYGLMQQHETFDNGVMLLDEPPMPKAGKRYQHYYGSARERQEAMRKLRGWM